MVDGGDGDSPLERKEEDFSAWLPWQLRRWVAVAARQPPIVIILPLREVAAAATEGREYGDTAAVG